jgi:hypothetical protein
MIAASATIAMTPEQARAHFASCEPKGFVADTVRVLRREAYKRETLIRERLSPSRAGRIALELAERSALLPAARSASSADDGPPIHPLPPSKIAMFAAQARFRIDKAAKLLGYRPAFDLDRGMAITEEWARWARIA